MEQNKSYGEVKQAILFTIIVILFILLLLLGIGFFTSKQLEGESESTKNTSTQNTQKEQETEDSKGQTINLNDNTIISTRLINILSSLNNSFLETADSNIGYIYQNVHADVTTLSNNYIIYTAISFLEGRGELEDYIEAQYNKRASAELVDETIKNIFGDINYNRLGYLGNDITCPNGKYDVATNTYLINTNCKKNDVHVDTYNVTVHEKPDLIEVYQAVSWAKNTENEYTVYKDIELKEYVSNNKEDRVGVMNSDNYRQYKFTFTKGSEGLYHFTSVDLAS